MSYLDWHVGMKVVCVDDQSAPTIRQGRIYTIASIRSDSSRDIRGVPSPVSVDLVEADPLPYCRGFNAARFRPVQTRKTDISIFTAMLHDQHDKVPA